VALLLSRKSLGLVKEPHCSLALLGKVIGDF
jgi:hypothetical protein